MLLGFGCSPEENANVDVGDTNTDTNTDPDPRLVIGPDWEEITAGSFCMNGNVYEWTWDCYEQIYRLSRTLQSAVCLQKDLQKNLY